MIRKRTEPVDRFLRSIEASPTGCWLWIRYIKPNGYASFGDENGDKFYAHRFAYEYFIQSIPSGLDIDHLCRVRHCVNPTHLEAVTRRENLRRGNHRNMVIAETHWCHNGHLIAGDNIAPSRDGRFRCRICAKERCRAYYYKHKAA